VQCATNFVDYLHEFEDIFEKALTCVSRTQGKLFDEKKTEVENLVSGSHCSVLESLVAAPRLEPRLT
jgi:hypothetical protein